MTSQLLTSRPDGRTTGGGASDVPRGARPAAGRWATRGRVLLGLYFFAMALVNAVVTLPSARQTYRGLTDLTWPGFTWIPEHVVVPIAVPFTVALIGWECAVGVLLLSRGRAVRIGLAAVLLQLLGLAPFLGWYEVVNLLTALLVLPLLRREHPRSALDLLAGRHPLRRVTGQLHPQDYGRDAVYRPPARWYRRLNPIGVPLTALGLAPRDAVTLEVRGRTTGRTRRLPILVTRHEGSDYLVALAGEAQWVRNVRAAGGCATLRRRGTRRVRLEEVPVAERAPVLAAYLQAGVRRSDEPAAREQARWYFGFDGLPSLDQLAEVAPRYPVFRIALTGTAPTSGSVGAA